MVVAQACRAGDERLFEHGEGVDPLCSARSRRDAVGRKGGFEGLRHLRRKVVEAGRTGRRRKPGLPARPGKAEACNGVRHTDGSGGRNAGEGMAAHEKKLEDHDGKAEGIVIARAHGCGKRSAGKLRRRVFRHTHMTGVERFPVVDLEAVGIDEGDPRIVRDENAGMVDIADDTAGVMGDGNRTGDVPGSTDQKPEICLGKMLFARSGCVKLVQGRSVLDPRHEEAGEAAAGVLHGGARKSHDAPLVMDVVTDLCRHHGPDLGFPARGASGVIELNGEIGRVGERIHFPLAALSKPGAKGERRTIGEHRRSQANVSAPGRLTAITRVLSSSVRALTGSLSR